MLLHLCEHLISSVTVSLITPTGEGAPTGDSVAVVPAVSAVPVAAGATAAVAAAVAAAAAVVAAAAVGEGVTLLAFVRRLLGAIIFSFGKFFFLRSEKLGA